jgi:hypothetical protein
MQLVVSGRQSPDRPLDWKRNVRAKAKKPHFSLPATGCAKRGHRRIEESDWAGAHREPSAPGVRLSAHRQWQRDQRRPKCDVTLEDPKHFLETLVQASIG